MHPGTTAFSQVMQQVHPQQFRRCVDRYDGDRRFRSLSCSDQFLAMAFAQLTYREGLRDIESCLNSQSSLLHQIGFRSRICRSTLAEANEKRDWRIYADLAQILIAKARRLYCDEDLGLDLKETVYALDSTTIDLCLSLFPWARFRRTKGAVKLHTLLDLRGPIPTFIEITDGKLQDVKILDLLIVEPGAYYVMDRGYLDFRRLYQLRQAGGHFITRAKRGFQFIRHSSRPINQELGLRSDQIGRLATPASFRHYPEKLRRVRFHDAETDRVLTFLTDQSTLPALTVCQLYKQRWQVELFFKWIKQHLRIRSFYGTSANAVKTQVWIAICVYVLVAILRKEFILPHSLHSMLQVLSVNAFAKVPIFQLLAAHSNETRPTSGCINVNQLNLFDF